MSVSNQLRRFAIVKAQGFFLTTLHLTLQKDTQLT